MISTDKLSITFAALSDPTRRAILGRLSRGEKSVSELAKPFEMTMPAITKHLKVLERAGLIGARPRSTVATLPIEGQAASRSGRLDRTLPTILGRELGPA